jgi:hypothetical protein
MFLILLLSVLLQLSNQPPEYRPLVLASVNENRILGSDDTIASTDMFQDTANIGIQQLGSGTY